MVRITTWNVNGIRNPLGYKPWSDKRTYDAMFDILETDIVIMQELKIQRKDLTDDMVLVPGWDCYFSLPKHKKGYSGVGIYTRQSVCAPIRAEEGLLGVLCPPGSSTPYRELPEGASIGGYPTAYQVADLGVDPDTLDAEGRCLVIEFPAFVLFGVYSPANSNGLRDDFRYGFLTALDTRIRNLAKMGKNVILTGDLNVSRDLIDTARAEDNMRSEGMTHTEYLSTPNRRVFNQLLYNGKVPGERDEGREEPVLYDLCREFHPDREGMYTHWEQKINARPGNFGSRIDFVLCSITIKDWFMEANIQEGLMGSDHCPVYAVTKDKVPTNGTWQPAVEGIELQEETHVLDLMNPPGMFKNGVRQREYNPTKDVPPLSGKLLPEFTRRRNIRDMFSKKPALANPAPAPTFTPSEAGTISNVGDGVDVAPLAATNNSDKETTQLAETTSTIPSSSANSYAAPSPSPLNSPEKRRAPSASPVKSVKRSKSNLSATNTPSLAKGQQSLKGFFQSRTKSADPIPVKDTAPRDPASPAANDPTAPADSLSQSETNAIPPSLPQAYIQTDPLASQEASKEGWTKLFSKKPPPRCEGHAEPCIILTTKKPGVNCGRQFWMCPRPIGPSGQKETGTQWRCGTFIWASDWKG
ncbi:Endonuclease/exonuclease/phosphatase [Paraphoma chrysanthemicola]|uniref:DNA-(apurinic or apyrimidinic site) endonuclease 2 n=1 Tax=Paraphoma chrysanthemicola TaxID=798071 RepID=A0A8K0QZ16_9PLEO|nr:Endonuclease/exonuclease/phosphatase [Paraphoma chrysanthemicola]